MHKSTQFDKFKLLQADGKDEYSKPGCGPHVGKHTGTKGSLARYLNTSGEGKIIGLKFLHSALNLQAIAVDHDGNIGIPWIPWVP